MGDHANSSSHSAGVIPTNNSPTPQLIFLNASSQIPIKLSNDGSNYSSWKSQMTNLLFGYDLLGYVDGSTPCPDKSAPNLSFWNRQDRLVLLALQSTVSGPVGPIINSCQTSTEAWEKLESSFGNTSITRMLSLHNSLATTKKAGKSVTEYMGIMEGLVDDLATIGHPVSSGQVMSYVLNGFGQEYKETISALRIQPTPLTLSTLRHHLQQAEILAGDNPDTSISVQYSVFNNFRALIENYFKTTIKTLYTDGGGEFTALTPLLSHHGIQHLKSPPYTPEHVGSAERKHRHVVETALALILQAKVPLYYWPYAFKHATYLINRMPTPTLQNDTPYHKLFGDMPHYSSLKVFGCLCYPWMRPYTKHKLQPRFESCVYLGFSTTHHAHQCLHSQTRRIYLTRHALFFEKYFPYNSPNSLPPSSDYSHSLRTFISQLKSMPLSVSPTALANPSSTDNTIFHSTVIPLPSQVPQPVSTPHNPTTSSLTPTHSPSPSTIHSPFSEHSPSPPTSTSTPSVSPSSSTSVPSPPPVQPHRPVTRSQNHIVKPNPKYNFHTTTSSIPVAPTSYKQASSHPEWRQAMMDEYAALEKNNTWSLVPPSPLQNVIGCKWVYRVKQNPDGSLARYKARLVAKGFHQRPGVDFTDTFSLVVKPATVRLVLTLAIIHCWPIRQLDVNNAFLQGTLSDKVYMQQPPGFINKAYPHHVCLLRKALYGLCQAPRAWYCELKTYLLQFGFLNSRSDTSLFIYSSGSTLLFLLVYVDDIIQTGNDSRFLESFISALAGRFSLKDLGSLSYFLGLEASRTSSGLFLTQHKYISDLLSRTGMNSAAPTPTPVSPNDSLSG
ncbi:unnamed protein product [Cuscuta europaea]|uniref:Integrase catalytic domain-containing protein n=1 Tax=Cuscuta europaea TaxID=41803 RepID=A0A9P0Z550_CUSEU|nr:unnamed protein product [Cuscuta europaea]